MKKSGRIFAYLLILGAFGSLVCLGREKAGEKKKAESKGPIAPPRRDVPGKRFQLSLGSLYVPEFFNQYASAGADIVLFFHGAAWCSEQNFFDARKNAVIVSISVKNYGYPEVFSDPKNLRDILEETTKTLARNDITSKPLGRICLSSFSGGYSAIREILKQEEFLPRITDVVLADSLYPAKIKDTQTIDPESIKPFLDFAEKAARGEAGFWFSHLYPPEAQHRGNTTTLAASYLIDQIGAIKKDSSGVNSRGAKLLYRADKGNFHVLGYSGMTTQDHFEHFYSVSDLFRETSLDPARENLRPWRDFETSAHFDEQIKRYTIEPGAKVHINAPSVRDFDSHKPAHLIFFALPNGNTTEQTIGKKLKSGVDWHFGIQHIGAQTRRLREAIKDKNIVTVYLEAEGRSWPSWRQRNAESGSLIKEIIESAAREFDGMQTTIHLSGHSGGGSFIFGFLNGVEHIPDNVKRISFLDSNYGYSDAERHGDKIVEWLGKSSDHRLVVICYDDRDVTLNGKPIVGPTGGTWRRTINMIHRLERAFPMEKTREKDVTRYRDQKRQIDILMHENPEKKILHTALVGDMNGFIHAETSGTEYEGKAAAFNGPVTYERWIQGD
ncbi:hypothetical protein JW926_02845 [Candidatus Sumerlaeota bacterium]|nr:hypothetical protein [Candidatus Sumerlaeota bacterium]